MHSECASRNEVVKAKSLSGVAGMNWLKLVGWQSDSLRLHAILDAGDYCYCPSDTGQSRRAAKSGAVCAIPVIAGSKRSAQRSLRSEGVVEKTCDDCIVWAGSKVIELGE